MEDTKKKPEDRRHEKGWHDSANEDYISMGGHFSSEGPHSWQEEATAANRKLEHEPYLADWEADASEVKAEMPTLRTGDATANYADVAGRVRKIKFQDEPKPDYEASHRDTLKDMCYTAGVGKKPADTTPAKGEVRQSLLERYKNAPQGTIRRMWADCDNRGESGLPVYMQKMINGVEDEYEIEILKYNKLAGSKYKTPKMKIKAEVERMQKDNKKLVDMLGDMSKKMEAMVKKLALSHIEIEADAEY